MADVAAVMLETTPGVVTDDMMRANGLKHPNTAVRQLRDRGVKVDRVIGLGYRLRRER